MIEEDVGGVDVYNTGHEVWLQPPQLFLRIENSLNGAPSELVQGPPSEVLEDE